MERDKCSYGFLPDYNFLGQPLKCVISKEISRTNQEDMNTQSIPITIKALATVLN